MITCRLLMHTYLYASPTCRPPRIARARAFHMGFDYNFTNYDFRKPSIVKKKYIARGMKFKGRF